MKNTNLKLTYFAGLLLVSAVLAACQPQASAPETKTPGTVQEAAPKTEAAPTSETIQPETTTGEVTTKTITKNYQTPAGDEVANFIFTLDGTTLEKVDLDITTKREISIKMQTAFAGGINDLVAGKDISDIEDLDVVSGSSLTPKAFNEAVDELQQML